MRCEFSMNRESEEVKVEVPQHQAPSPPAENVREIDSAELFQGDREVLIRHHGEVYRLRLTKNDRLILHK